MATKPGERKLQILQTLAAMLEDPKGEKITTAALAARLDVSEAALYRHFASKAQMYEGLIEFIEGSLFGLINKITAEEENGLKQVHAVLSMLLGFAEKNPGMTRVLIGDALVNENERLQARINQLHDRLEATLKQCLRIVATQAPQDEAPQDEAPQNEAPPAEAPQDEAPPAEAAPAPAPTDNDTGPHANLLLCYVVGRWHQFAKSGFKRKPSESFERQWPLLIA